MTLKTIETAALKLPLQARSQLAATLLSSLESDDSAEIERAWIEEAERRYREYRSGRSSVIPAEQAIAEGRAALRK